MMLRLLRLIWTFIRLSALNELQYRANFFMQFFSSLLTLANGLIGLALVFYHTETLAGWEPMELLVVVGVYTIIGGLIRAMIQPNMWRILEGVHEGTLDFTLTKPEDSQLLVSMANFELWKLVDVIIGIVVLGYAVLKLGARAGIEEAFIFAIVLLCGGLMVYSLWLAIATTSFWVVRVWSLFDFFEAMYQAGRWPVGIYPSWLRMILTFLVPVAFAVTAPAEALTARLNAQMLILAIVVAATTLIASRMFWKFGLRNYTGASA
jgi:ABC-2 type transport system permease protein